MTIEVGPLIQYGTLRVRLTETEARQLDTAAGTAVTVATDPEPGWWQLIAHEYVGSLVVGNMHVLIRPKIPPENLFLLLEVGLPESAWRREAFEYATGADLLPSVIAFFARTVETVLARGVMRSYREYHDQLATIRGRIDMAGAFRQPGIAFPISCYFDEFTADIAENQYLRAAVRRALRVPTVPGEDRRRLLQHLVALEEAADVDVRPESFDAIAFTRLNAHYEPALRLARLILENLTLVDQRGRATASSFLVDMNKLFERFITERLRRALRGRLEVRAEPPVHLGAHGQVLMYPDLEFRRRGRTVFVGDVKYKLTGTGRARNDDYYQLLAYTTALDMPEGVLIYCLTEGGRPERQVTVRYADKLLHTRAVQLGGSPTEVAAEVEALADWIAGRAAGRPVS